MSDAFELITAICLPIIVVLQVITLWEQSMIRSDQTFIFKHSFVKFLGDDTGLPPPHWSRGPGD